jgi:hypothetical protein
VNSRRCTSLALTPRRGATPTIGASASPWTSRRAGTDPASRQDVEILYEGLAAPVDLDLDLKARLIYWTARGDDTINRAPIDMPTGKTAATRDDRQIIVQDVSQAIGLALDHAHGLVYYTDAQGDLGRAAFDGSNAEFLQRGDGALTGIVVVNLP